MLLEQPTASVQELEEQHGSLVGKRRCQILLDKSHSYHRFLQVISQLVVRGEDLDHHAEALLGAIGAADDGGDLFSIIQCWECMAGESGLLRALSFARMMEQSCRKG